MSEPKPTAKSFEISKQVVWEAYEKVRPTRGPRVSTGSRSQSSIVRRHSAELSNAELDSTSPVAGILLGQPTPATRLRQGIFAALDQRISVRYTIGGMDLAESIAYLRHHLAIAGRNDPLIADDAAARLHRYAKRAAPSA